MPPIPAGADPGTLVGLDDDEVARRRAAGLGNRRTPPAAGRSYLRIVIETTAAPVNVFLFATCLLLVWLGLAVDAAVTAVPVLLNVVAGVVLETRAKRQLDRLAIIARPVARVVRAGRERDVDPEELVLGDLVVASRGDQIVLDGQIEDGLLEIDESLLTGEADPIRRSVGDPVLSGSACLSGRAAYRVTHVGPESYANRLVLRAREATSERTPLQRDVGRLVGGSALLVLLAGMIIAVDFALGGELATREAIQAAAVLVAIIPQGLAIIATLVYAAGALSISRQGALVQRINAVESMSRVDVLVLDKTGTLTSAELALEQIDPMEPDVVAGLSALASQPTFSDRTTGAIRAWLDRTGRPASPGRGPAVAFTSDRRWSAAAMVDGRTAVLGAPEVLLTAGGGGGLLERAGRWADEGLRVLVLAIAGSGSDDPGQDRRPELPRGLRPAALLGFSEQLRPDAAATLQELHMAGIRLKVASGDHRRTVAAIAARVGIDDPDPQEGTSLASLDDGALAERAEAGTVFGRIEPALKARLIHALRAGGHYVAMLGDGVNDIIALKEANLGLAMQSGSAAARAAADVVLLGDAFGILPRAVVTGQRIVEGMRLVSCLLFTRTIYALVVVIGAAILALDFPLTPRTNSILALVTVGIPTLVLAAWAPAGHSRAGLLRSSLRFAAPAGLAVAAVALPVYATWLARGADLDEARTALTAVSAWCGILLIPFLLPPGRGRDGRPTLLAGAMAILFAAVLGIPVLRDLFELAPLPPIEIGGLGLVAVAWAVILFRIRASRLVVRCLIWIERRLGRAGSRRPTARRGRSPSPEQERTPGGVGSRGSSQ